MIIGVVGRNAAGKTTICRHLEKKGFMYHSLSDVLRQEAVRKGIAPTRQNLIKLGNDLRKQHGAGFLAEKVNDTLDSGRNHCVDSIRHPLEAGVFQKRKDFVLWFVDSAEEKRFERALARARDGDPLTLMEFRKSEAMEEKNAEETGQQLATTIEGADLAIENNGSSDELYARVDAALNRNFSETSRPSWEEYFISVAKTIATRSNCVKRKVASIIVKDKRIISTGYNGTPRGVKNCNEGGCPRCNSFAQSGTRLEECLCSHGEENAIVQASYHGVSLKGSTLYTTYAPCLLCAKMIINAGIEKVVYNAEYPLNDTAKKILLEAGVVLEQYKG